MENANQVTAINANFGTVIQAIKDGLAAKRSGWKEREFIWMVKGNFDYNNTDQIAPSDIEGIPYPLFELGDKNTVTRFPKINMQTSSGGHVLGWNPSQLDMLAEDWVIL